MRVKYALVAVALILAIVIGTSFAGEIDPGLKTILDSTPPGEQVSVLVFLHEQVDVKAMDRDLTDQRVTIQQRHETVVRSLQEKASTTQIEVTAYLDNLKEAARIGDFRALWISNVIQVKAERTEIEAIAQRPEVMKVFYDYELELIEPVDITAGEPGQPGIGLAAEPGLTAIRAPEVWALGITGVGVLVANIDTGVEGSHPALADCWAGVADSRYAGHPEWAWYDPYLGQNDFPYDNNGHGTHTMGTICGGAPGDDVGVAPGAYWIAAGAIDRGGGIPQTMSDAMLSFEWMLDPDGDPGTNWDVPDVISNSWGVTTSHGYAPCDETLWSYIDACEAAGSVVLWAAGNEGTGGLRRPGDRATDDYRNCAVAAVDANTAGWPIASFSSRGPTYCTPTGDPAIKPDIAAPGVSVRSAYPGGGYSSMSGTSMACPHVAGVVALMRQANPNIGVDQVKQIIYQTAYDLGSAGEDNDYGWGMIDAYEAVMLAMPDTLVANFYGTPTTGREPMTVNFFDISIGDVTSWDWDFGDGGTSTEENPTYTYTTPGIYTVTLTVTGPQGTDDEVKVDYITVDECFAPVADFSGTPTSGGYPLRVDFTDLSTNDPDSWSWDFGDGGTSDVQNPTYTYTAAGTYTVSLTVTTPCGTDNETKIDYITVIEPPFADLPYSTGFETGSLDQYWKTFSSEEGRVLITSANTPRGTYHMTMDDYLDAGLYSLNEAWLRVNLAGLSDVDLTFWWKEFADEDHAEDGVFFSDDGGASFVKVRDLILGTTIYEEILLDVDQLAAANGLNLTGTFVIKFQQYDNYGITTDGMAFDDISVTSGVGTPPVADFEGVPTSGYAPLGVQFTDLSSGGPASWDWDFGDGGTSTDQNPYYTYNDTGSFTVSLTVSNAYGSDNETKADYITVTQQSVSNIHVDNIVVDRYMPTSQHWAGRATVTIVDQDGVPVQGAEVSGFFNAPDTKTQSGTTGANGEAVITSKKTRKTPADWCFEVTDVVKSGESYDPDANVVTKACESGPVFRLDIDLKPSEFALSNYPNPFNATTQITFDLPEASNVKLEIFNIIGQRVEVLVDKHLPAGTHSYPWDAGSVASGVYLYRAEAGEYIETKKMMLLK